MTDLIAGAKSGLPLRRPMDAFVHLLDDEGHIPCLLGFKRVPTAASLKLLNGKDGVATVAKAGSEGDAFANANGIFVKAVWAELVRVKASMAKWKEVVQSSSSSVHGMSSSTSWNSIQQPQDDDSFSDLSDDEELAKIIDEFEELDDVFPSP